MFICVHPWLNHAFQVDNSKNTMKTLGNQTYYILIVDDEPSVCESIKMLLEHDGHKAQTVGSGEVALALLEHETFDLIITDYSMA